MLFEDVMDRVVGDSCGARLAWTGAGLITAVEFEATNSTVSNQQPVLAPRVRLPPGPKGRAPSSKAEKPGFAPETSAGKVAEVELRKVTRGGQSHHEPRDVSRVLE